MISVQNVSKRYFHSRRLWTQRESNLEGPADAFWALRDINIDIPTGTTFGIVGPNGSGKSTLLQIIAGILTPTSGRVLASGRISALLELGAGFNLEFTGRENVILNSELMGLSRSEIERVLPDIEAFAEIGPFFDRPVREYSSGMYVRLAFSAAIHQSPEILIVDEALAVGDARFANRCIRRLEQLQSTGATILFVSHDLGLVQKLCSQAALLWEGQLAFTGPASEVAKLYNQRVQTAEKATALLTTGTLDAPAIRSLRLLDASGQPATRFETNASIHLEITLDPAPQPFQTGVLIRNRQGLEVAGTNTTIEESPAPTTGQPLRLDVRFPAHFTRGDYTITVATQHLSGARIDWRDDALEFSVLDRRPLAGLTPLDATFDWQLLEK